jgi:hypothetical protein
MSGDFLDEHYIDPDVFDALVREQRRRIRRANLLKNVRSLVLGASTGALLYFVLHALKVF